MDATAFVNILVLDLDGRSKIVNNKFIGYPDLDLKIRIIHYYKKQHNP